MRYQWLKPFACGVAIASLASVCAWLYAESTKPSKVLILSYIKGEGLYDPPLPPDPAPQYSNPADYVARIARSCGVKTWMIQSEANPDAPVMADLEVQWKDVSDKMFSCLSKFVTPPRVTMRIKSTNGHSK